ncbi:MAG: hypothetical protein II401_02075 [Bacteroidales bacterium]|nr:hypothetical protein [Bacteroidales bacterium]
MKKILLAIAIVFILGFGASAQKDGFFGWYASDNDTYRISEGGDNFVLPTDHGTGMDQDAPLGTGLLILTAIGGAYAITRRKQ